MPLHNEANDNPQAAVRQAWNKGNILELFQAGLDNFMSMLFDRPIPFLTFLNQTSIFFDKFILDTSREEQIKYVGGELIMTLEQETIILLTAKFYFQDIENKWALKEKRGQVDNTRFSDWNTAPELAMLRKTKNLKFSIEPPKKKRV